ncbi:MAG TPA: acetolactate synthase [Actinobacteria bacterium]|nr:acetolactate synthase [Actinomycetota bacterium]
MPFVTGGQAVVDTLIAHGVDTVFGIPGTHSLPLYAALARCPIRHVTPRSEQGGGYAADGYARSSGRPGVCIVTSGPGLTNIATPVGQAYSDSIPLLVISPGMPAEIEGGDRGYLHEMKSQVGMMNGIASWSHRTRTHQDAVNAIDRAFREFATSRPRPVHIEIPLDMLAEPGWVDTHKPYPGRVPAPLPDRLQAVADVLRHAESPALVFGGGARRAARQARKLAERLGAGVVTTVNGKGVLSEDHPLSLGASIRLQAAQAYLESADVLVAVGTELGDSDLWGACLRPRGTVVRLDIDYSQLQKNVPAQLTLLGDAAGTLTALLEHLPGADSSHGSRKALLHAVRGEIQCEAKADGAEWIELLSVLEHSLSKDAIVTGDSAMVCYYGFAHFYPQQHPSSFLYPTGFATLGFSLPAAIGAKIAEPTRQVVALSGDGGLLFTVGEIATAVEQRLGIPIIIVNNQGYGEIRRQMVQAGMPRIGVDLANPDFADLARAFGSHGVSTELDGLEDALGNALDRDLPTIIELKGWTR